MWNDLGPSIRSQLEASLACYSAVAPLIPTATLVGFDPDENYLCLRGVRKEAAAALCAAFRVGEDILATPRFTFIKRAGTAGDLGRSFGNAFQQTQSALGGPNALTTTLVGGALGGLGGYAVGRVADRVIPSTIRALLPQEYQYQVGESKWAPLLAAAGAGVGALPGLGRGLTAIVNEQSPLSQYPWSELSPAFEKAAEDAGALFVPAIPVDAFNRAIWTGPDPLPGNVAAAIGGIVNAAGAAKRQEYISPWDIAQVAANVGAGGLTGLATGMLAGKALGALAGLGPEAQDSVKRTGLWSGIMTGLARSIF